VAPNINGNHIRGFIQYSLGFQLCTSSKNIFFSPKWPHSSGIVYSDTCHNYTVLVEAFGGQFGAIQGNFGPSEAPEQDIEANLGWIFSLSSSQNDLNTPK